MTPSVAGTHLIHNHEPAHLGEQAGVREWVGRHLLAQEVADDGFGIGDRI